MQRGHPTNSTVDAAIAGGQPGADWLQAATLADDATLLRPWARAFAKVCGAEVQFSPLDPNEAAAGTCLTFPAVFEQIEIIGGVGHFAHRPAMAAHVRRLGFAWDASGRVMTVPAPGAFNDRMARLGLAGDGFQLSYSKLVAPMMPLGPWLKRYMHGVITLLVNAPSFYDDLVQRASDQERVGARWGLSSIAHDLSVHALNYHLIPDAAVDDLAGRIRAALPARYADWSRAEASAPLTLTYFYDNDFNRYTYGVWCNCERPEDFAAIFLAERNYAQLVAALEIRLRETAAGIGDVASGVVDDMGPLTPTSFEI